MTPTPPAPVEQAGALLGRLRIRMDLEGVLPPEETEEAFTGRAASTTRPSGPRGTRRRRRPSRSAEPSWP
ncbi:hypothetical protein ACFQXA_36530 [Nocardiopsis composta]